MIKLKNQQKHMRNKIISILLILIMIISTFEPLVLAVENLDNIQENKEYEYGDFIYTVNNGEVTIKKYIGENPKAIIPEKIGIYDVTVIGDDAFVKHCANYIFIPSTVKEIKRGPIWLNLLSDSLISIEVDSNNKNYASIDGVLFNKDITELIAYPAGKTETTYSIPNGVTDIAYVAFNRCQNLVNIEIPSSVKNIDVSAFQCLKNLKNITIPASVVNMGEEEYYTTGNGNPFSECYNLTSINVEENNSKYSSVDGVLFNKDKTILITYPYAKEQEDYVIPDSLKEIRNGTFSTCKNLRNVKIPNGITKISDTMFYRCENLESVNIPDNVTKIEHGAFLFCNNVDNVIIPNSVKSIGESAFQACTNLKSITLSQNINTIEAYTFDACISLQTLGIPYGVTSIGQGAFGSSGLTNITIPDTVTTIGDSAFSACNNLEDITLPKSFFSIGEDPFWRSGLKRIHGCRNSYAETFADMYGFEFVAIEDENIKPVSAAEGSFKCANQEFSGEKGFKYNDNYFEGDATTYNHKLATMSLCLAYSAYNTNTEPFATDEEYKNNNVDANVKELLYKCGFSNYHGYNYDVKPKMDDVACAIASKKISSGETVIAIAVRGGGYESEWGSNFYVGYEGDHAGFEHASMIVYNRLMSYIEETQINGNVKIWITGFSRAAATANLCAAKLTKDGSGKWFENVFFDSTDIYAYCFATPAGAEKSNEPNSEKYNNIFNIVHYYDPVPLVAPSYWNFDRYGKTYIFPFKESLKGASVYKKKMLSGLNEKQKKYYEFMSNPITVPNDKFGRTYTNIGTFLRKNIISLKNYSYSEINNSNSKEYYPIAFREDFVSSHMQESIRDAFSYLYGNNISTEGTNGKKIEPLDVIFKHLGEFVPTLLLQYLNTILEGIKLKDCLFVVHAEPDYYLAWMQSLNGEEDFTDGSGRLLYINCPVDVFIYDSSDSLVASIVNEIPNNIEIITFVDENGQKLIYLPKDEDYKIKIVAREECQTTITIDEYEGVSSEVSKIISYSNVVMKEKEEVIATVTKFAESNNKNESGASYSLNISGKEITPDINISEGQVKDYTYVITTQCDEEQGKVYGGGVFNIGEFCKVTATSKQGYSFEGWYIDEQNVSKEETFRFAVKEKATLKAKFRKNEIHTHTLIKTDAKASTCITTGNNAYFTCSGCGKIFKDTLGIVETTIEDETLQIDSTAHNWDDWVITTPSTETSKGEKTRTCKNDSTHKETEIIAKLPFEYKILEGQNQEYSKGNDLVVKVNGEFRKFVELRLNGEVLETANYRVKSGSTIVTLKDNYLSTLLSGEYTLTFVYTDGEVSTKFKISKTEISEEETNTENKNNENITTENKIEENNSNSPQTGDNIILWMILMIGSIIGFLGTVKYIRKRYNK